MRITKLKNVTALMIIIFVLSAVILALIRYLKIV